ncbi:alanine dehydrogenase [Chthoniobacter flavus Ellin428]|uniref:Alanine dehydrogenase n=1 Tax=Chthoniobacter flavus Ellin428 TaxID=497964 RepID=B4CVH0_9BACT|nr:alanine dehydrogenase [Chthoniobacter flavus]EDY21412.1 alanine dehydrogenase [Chthoniobacter flavus Ellin428]TCO95372.1 L-alanine dehydrogenase [Chthoniobacter flavus]
MIVGVPKEIKAQENRVGLLPSAIYQLVQRGHKVLAEKSAGVGAGYPDEEYVRAGAELVNKHAEIFERADMVVKVKEPLPEEYGLLREGQILFTYLHLAASKPLTEALVKSRVTAIAYETVEVNRRLPLLEPMSEIAGRMSIIVGGYFLAKHCGGKGVLLGGVPGVLPGKVIVIGGGTAGVNAARMATGLGADVTILEVDVERMRFLDITMHTAHTLYSSPAHVTELLPSVDLLIGAVLVPGAKAPKLISRDMLKLMKPGSVLVDIAIDQGGCVETSHPTTHEKPTFVEEDVIHYCVANMPAAYARTATQALTNVTSRYVELLADHGVPGAFHRDPHLLGGLNLIDGHITLKAVAEAHNLPFMDYGKGSGIPPLRL